MATQIPPDKVNLKLILVSGKTKEFRFNPSDSVSIITQHVYDNWPQDWSDEQYPTTNILRLIYQGRFLHGSVTLAEFFPDHCGVNNSKPALWSLFICGITYTSSKADYFIVALLQQARNYTLQSRLLYNCFTLAGLQLPTGKTTVMHMVARETLPEPNSQSQMKKDKSGDQSNCCIVV